MLIFETIFVMVKIGITITMMMIKVGMCTGMIYNLIRKLTEDKEDILASRWDFPQTSN